MTSAAVDDPPAGPGVDRRIIVMVGAPGAGKGTQAERLATELGLPHVSTGELFREAARGEGKLGATIRSYLDKGALVPDDAVMAIVERRLAEADAQAGAILDGFPRTRAQAVALDETLARTGATVTAALYVEVAPELLVKRLTGRRVCSLDDQHVYHIVNRPPRRSGVCDLDGAALQQRDDDTPETVQRRLETQLPPMYEVIDHYSDSDVLFAVRGDHDAEEVTEELLHALRTSARGASR